MNLNLNSSIISQRFFLTCMLFSEVESEFCRAYLMLSPEHSRIIIFIIDLLHYAGFLPSSCTLPFCQERAVLGNHTPLQNCCFDLGTHTNVFGGYCPVQIKKAEIGSSSYLEQQRANLPSSPLLSSLSFSFFPSSLFFHSCLFLFTVYLSNANTVLGSRCNCI